MLLNDLVATSRAVADTSSRLEKVSVLADFLRKLGPDEAHVAVTYLAGHPVQSPLGVGYAAVQEVRVPPAPKLRKFTRLA